MQEELDKLKFFAKPKLALDAVGGTSAVRICEALAEVCCAPCAGFTAPLRLVNDVPWDRAILCRAAQH